MCVKSFNLSKTTPPKIFCVDGQWKMRVGFYMTRFFITGKQGLANHPYLGYVLFPNNSPIVKRSLSLFLQVMENAAYTLWTLDKQRILNMWRKMACSSFITNSFKWAVVAAFSLFNLFIFQRRKVQLLKQSPYSPDLKFWAL